AGLPHWTLHHVPHPHLTLPITRETHPHRLPRHIMRQRDDIQCLAQLAVQHGIEEADALDIGEAHPAQALSALEVELLSLDGAVLAGRYLLLLDTDDAAADGPWLAGSRLGQDHFHLLATGLVEDLAKGRVAAEVDGETLQGLIDRVVGVIRDSGNGAAIE